MKIRFADFVLDHERFLLERGGEHVPLRPKVFDLLVQLVRNHKRVVRREELVDQLWDGLAVGAGALSGLVNELRQALGEDGRGGSSIRTVHARGYQFVAAVEEFPESGSCATGAMATTDLPLTSDAVSLLVERVAEEGARGILISNPAHDPAADAVDSLARSDLDAVVAGAQAVGFEVRWLRMPDESLASTARFARHVIDAMVESRGWDVVRGALPLPARRWFEQALGDRVAGGITPTTLAPPGGVGAVAVMLSELARRQPMAWVLDGVDRSGPCIARDLGALLRRLSADPVLWIGTVAAESEAAIHALEKDAGFESFPIRHFARAELARRLRRVEHASLPQELGDALVALVNGDLAVVNEIADWLDVRRTEDLRRSSSAMRRVEPKPRSRAAAGVDP